MTIERAGLWGLVWRSCNALDGEQRHLICEAGLPLLYRTRRAALADAELRFGYIRRRPDLQAEPHGWRMPRAVRVTIAAQEPARLARPAPAQRSPTGCGKGSRAPSRRL
jgi:hypothetical protein